jgi:hypothetical protein
MPHILYICATCRTIIIEARVTLPVSDDNIMLTPMWSVTEGFARIGPVVLYHFGPRIVVAKSSQPTHKRSISTTKDQFIG